MGAVQIMGYEFPADDNCSAIKSAPIWEQRARIRNSDTILRKLIRIKAIAMQPYTVHKRVMQSLGLVQHMAFWL